jgi:hypothetical protein
MAILTTNEEFPHRGGELHIRATAETAIQRFDAGSGTWTTWYTIAAGTESKVYSLPAGRLRPVFASGEVEFA